MSYGCLTVTRWNFFIGFSLHDALLFNPVTGYLPVDYWPHLDFGLVSGTHLFSYWTERSKTQILLDGVHWIGRGSDALPVVPHVDLVQGWNPLLPWNILFGSSISVWGTSGVTIGCDNPLFGNTKCDLACSPIKNSPISFHLSCNSPISLPLDVTVVWGTAKCGFTWGDFVACLVDIAIEIATDIVMKFGGAALKKLGKGALSGLKKMAGVAAEEAAGKALGKAVAKNMAKRVAGEVVEEAADTALAKAAKEAAGEAADVGASKAAKGASSGFSEGLEALQKQSDEVLEEAMEEVTESTASKSGKSAATSFAENLDEFRKGTDEAMEEVVEEAAEEAQVKTVKEAAQKAAKKSAEEADSFFSKAKNGIVATKTWWKATQTSLLANGTFWSILGYTAMKKGFKYSKKIYKNAYTIANPGKVGDQDAANSSYKLFLWNLGQRQGVIDDLDGPDEDIESEGSTTTDDRFVWVDETASLTTTATATDRFGWLSDVVASIPSSTETERFTWATDDESDAETATP